MLWWLLGIILGEIICKSSNWQHIQRLKITILGANWQLFRLERIAKCSYFILSTQTIKFYWFVMKIKTFLLPIWWYNRGSFPVGNKYFGVFVLNGLITNYAEICYFPECCRLTYHEHKALQTLFNIVEAPLKKLLNCDVCVVWCCSDGPLNSQQHKSFEIYAVSVKISMTEYHHWINGLADHLF